jgi:hypothetical protein
LTGDRIDNSPYMLYMRDDTTCSILCQQVYGKKDVEVLEAAIDEDYHHNWVCFYSLFNAFERGAGMVLLFSRMHFFFKPTVLCAVALVPRAAIESDHRQLAGGVHRGVVGVRGDVLLQGLPRRLQGPEGVVPRTSPSPRRGTPSLARDTCSAVGGREATPLTARAGLCALKVTKHAHGMGGMMKEMDASADYFLYNHVELIVKYHELGPDSNRVVGFYVQAKELREGGGLFFVGLAHFRFS